jgi:alpha-glucosidase
LYYTIHDLIVLETRLRVQIYDAAEEVYQIPSFLLEPPTGSSLTSSDSSELIFTYTSSPFSFAVSRRSNNETIFNTTGTDLIFESQYLRVRTSLPENPNIYGLGEDTDPFRRNTTNYTRTLWSRESPDTPAGTNLYGNHPVYFEHRQNLNQTHGVFLFNSDGMDVKINTTEQDGQYLEYNTIGGIVDFFFFAGPGPADVARQFSEVVGQPAMMPYWAFGLHQCKYGYSEYIVLAEVVQNYSNASIPLETMWTDIDYMDGRKVFTLNPTHFPLEKMQEFVSYLHDHDQHYIMMVDPAVAYQNYSAFNNGVAKNAFLKNNDSSIYQGVVWPGVTAFPDWMDPGAQDFWNEEVNSFFNAETGVDVDALWIDMNEASNFCDWPCSNATQYAIDNGLPPTAPPLLTTWPPLPGFPDDFQPPSKRQSGGSKKGLPGRNFTNPPYMINNAEGVLPQKTLSTEIIQSNGLAQYDTHNFYGTSMAIVARKALIQRRPTVRPLVITRSTFSGVGAHVGHWLGDNSAGWWWYQISIAQIIEFAALYQVPMVGADICGFNDNTTETICARWAMLGAFYPFMRNHAADNVINHEFYQWTTVADAARKAITARYQLLDYLYTAFYKQSQDGTPTLNPLFFLYPTDTNTLDISLQFFFGPSLLVSPAPDDDTTVTLYLPNDQFYDFWTGAPVRGTGANTTVSNVTLTDIPLHIRGGSIIPMRLSSANTTAALRKQNFQLTIAPGLDGTAKGDLYLDDGESLVQNATSQITFDYAQGQLVVGGTFGYQTNLTIDTVILLGTSNSTEKVSLQGKPLTQSAWKRDGSKVSVKTRMPLTKGWSMSIH